MDIICTELALRRCKHCLPNIMMPYGPSPYHDSPQKINCEKYEETIILTIKEPEIEKRMLFKQKEEINI